MRVPAGRYIIRSTVTLPRDVHLLMEGVFVYDDDEDEPILVIGEDDYVNQSILLRLAVERSATYASDWTSQDNIGIKLLNCYQCDINVVRASLNTIGVQCIGVGTSAGGNGFSYNTIRLGKIMDNQYAIDCAGKSYYSAGPPIVFYVGFCNQNTFIGGRVGVSSSYQTGKSRYGVRIYTKDYDSQNPTHLYNTHNNNRFINTSFELTLPQGQGLEALPVLIQQGWYNHFVGCRNETTGADPFARVENQSIYNELVTGYGTCVVDDQCAPSTEVPEAAPSTTILPSTSFIQQPAKGTYNSGSLTAMATAYKQDAGPPAVDYIMIPGLFLSEDEGQGGSDNRNLFLDGFTLASTFVRFDDTRAVGVRIGTGVQKRFIVRRAFSSGSPGRVRIRCYDSMSNLLTGDSPYYATGMPISRLVYAPNNFGGCYQMTSNSVMDLYFSVHEDVASVEVLISGADLMSFTIECVDGGSPSVLFFAGMSRDPNLRLAIEAPQYGYYLKGTRVYNAEPAQNDPQGWVCTSSGAPGSWLAMPDL